ncbi:MAG: hypothetical protein ACE5G6_01545 [Terriglobia bacterium]
MRRSCRMGVVVVEGVFSFHTLRDACLAGQPVGWREFVKTYSPVTRQLLGHYFPRQDQAGLLVRVFREARGEPGGIWKDFQGTSENEFLLHWRQFVIEQARRARGPAPETPLNPENFWRLLETFPLLQREMLILGFRRYRPEQLAELSKFSVEASGEILEQAQRRLEQQLGKGVGEELLRHDHDALFAAIEQQRGEKCCPGRVFVRLADGQISWREREEAERHIESCLHCLDRSAQYCEVARFFHVLPPPATGELQDLLGALELPVEEPLRKQTWWQRLLGG